MTRENPQKAWFGKKHVATPNELNNQHVPFASHIEEVEDGSLDDIESDASFHREIKEIESGVSEEELETIQNEIHKENTRRFQKDDTLGKDVNNHDKIEAQTKKRWSELVRADEIKKETEDILGSSRVGSLGEWDTLRDEEKKGFFEAKNVRDVLDVLKGKTVVQRWFRKGDKK
jgi:hypothetical protein